MRKVSQPQLELLSRAAAEPYVTIDPQADDRFAKALIVKRLAILLPAEGAGSRLIITEAGRAALARRLAASEPLPAAEALAGDTVEAASAAGDTHENAAPEPEDAPGDSPGAVAAEGPKGKLGMLVCLLRRPEGASIGDMMAATGWQAHSVRGAMSGALKKGLGLTVESEPNEAGRVYRIPAVTPPV